MNAGDFDLVVSPADGKAYMYFERVHSEMICADLTDDYTDFAGYYSTHLSPARSARGSGGASLFQTGREALLGNLGYDRLFSQPIGSRGRRHVSWSFHYA
jgi:hypothetical protein